MNLVPRSITDEGVTVPFVPPCSRDPEIFFSNHPSEIKRAKHMCFNECPAREACLDYAMETEVGQRSRYTSGIYGGLLPVERYRLRGLNVNEKGYIVA